jgi:hypothetical protein
MEANRFDKLVAQLAEGPSRRDALQGALGGVLALVGIDAISDDAGVEGKGKREGRGNKNRDWMLVSLFAIMAFACHTAGAGNGEALTLTLVGVGTGALGSAVGRSKNRKCKQENCLDESLVDAVLRVELVELDAGIDEDAFGLGEDDEEGVGMSDEEYDEFIDWLIDDAVTEARMQPPPVTAEIMVIEGNEKPYTLQCRPALLSAAASGFGVITEGQAKKIVS